MASSHGVSLEPFFNGVLFGGLAIITGTFVGGFVGHCMCISMSIMWGVGSSLKVLFGGFAIITFTFVGGFIGSCIIGGSIGRGVGGFGVSKYMSAAATVAKLSI